MSLLFRGKPAESESRGFNQANVWGDDGGLLSGTTVAGVAVSQDNVLAVTSLWACVSFIADMLATAKLDLYRIGADGRKTPLVRAPAWVTRPNLVQSRYAFWHSYAVSLLLDGNGFSPVARNSFGDVVELGPPVNPRTITVDTDASGRPVFVPQQGPSVPASGMFHVAAFTRPGSLRGVSPVSALSTSIGLTKVAEEFAARFFAQGANAGGVLEVPPGVDLDDDRARRLAERFKARASGMRNAHMPVALTGGMKWVKTTSTPSEAQMLEARKFQVAEMCRIYRMPQHLVGGETPSTWGTGIEQMNIGLVSYTLSPWYARIEEPLSDLLTRPTYAEFNVDRLLRGDVKTRMQYYQTLRMLGAVNNDFITQVENLPVIDDGSGSDYRLPFNTAHSGASGDGQQQPPAAADGEQQ